MEHHHEVRVGLNASTGEPFLEALLLVSEKAEGSTSSSSSSSTLTTPEAAAAVAAAEADVGDDSEADGATPHSILFLGIPPEMTDDVFISFIEPYLPELEAPVTFLNPAPQRCAILTTRSRIASQSFIDVYNNLHFPAYPQASPCLAIALGSPNASVSSQQNQQQLKPKQWNQLCLPTCTVCLRRIKTRVSRVPGSNIFPVSLHFAGNMEQCRTCRMYGTHILSAVEQEEEEEEYEKLRYSSLSLSWPRLRERPPPEWSCGACGLGENIWLCLVCSHAGCGRYTSQHAERHYMQTRHAFALELVTGRIWDYDHDTFVHAEDIAWEGRGEEASSGPTQNSSCGGGGIGVGARGGGGSRVRGGGGAADATTKWYTEEFDNTGLGDTMLPGLETGAAGSPTLAFFNAHPRLLRRRAAAEMRSGGSSHQGELDCGARGKISSVQSEYECLLESQLEAQRLFFDKMLAQETVRALELAFGSKSVNANAIASASSGLSANPNARGDVISFSGLATEEEMTQIEQRKLDISLLEHAQVELLAAIRSTEGEARKMRKSNDALIREQKMLRDREAELLERAKQVSATHAERAADLEQQITDLSFFVRTRAQVESSPWREEMEGGSLVVRQRPPPTPPSPAPKRR